MNPDATPGNGSLANLDIHNAQHITGNSDATDDGTSPYYNVVEWQTGKDDSVLSNM